MHVVTAGLTRVVGKYSWHVHCVAVYVHVVHDDDLLQCLGIRCVLLQDVSSIGCYLWDITLLFAQQQDNRELSCQISLLQVSDPPSHMMSHMMDRIMILKIRTHMLISAHVWLFVPLGDWSTSLTGCIVSFSDCAMQISDCISTWSACHTD